MAADNMHKNSVSLAVWFSSYASKQTDRHTNRHNHYNTSPVSNNFTYLFT